MFGFHFIYRNKNLHMEVALLLVLHVIIFSVHMGPLADWDSQMLDRLLN